MPTWKPAPEAAAAAFAHAIAGLEGAEPRKMFGYSCAFANGHMLAGLHELGMIIRLPEGERGQFIQQFGARLFEPMPGRVMREYVVVPATLLAATDELRAWLNKSLRYVNSLPPKSKRGPGKRQATSRGSSTNKRDA